MESVKEILLECNALLEGHFQYSSGLHGKNYVQCAKLLQYADKAEKVVAVLIENIKKAGIEFDVVVGPALGGVLVAYELGRQTGKRNIFTERKDGIMSLRRGFTINPGERIIIAEDVVTTGKSSMETARVVEELGGKAVAIACIVDRTENPAELPIISAVKLHFDTYEPDNCPLCKAQLPIDKPGSRPGK